MVTPPDEPAADTGDAPAPAAPRGHRWDAVHVTILALAVVVVVMVGVWGFQRIRGPQASAKFCAGVGLLDGGPAAPSPEQALDNYLALSPGSGTAADYERTDEFGDWDGRVAFRPIERTSGRSTALIARKSGSSWLIDGACA